MHKNHPVSRVRNRAHMIILSHKGYALKDIGDICEVTRHTVSSLISRWEHAGLAGLYDAPRDGRPRSLTPDDEEYVEKLTDQEPRSLNMIAAIFEDQRCKKVGKATVRRVIRKRRRWKRIRKSLKNRRNEKKFRRIQERIRELEQPRVSGETDVWYSDSAGFNMIPSVPYAWQPKGEHIEVPTSKSRNLSVLGFMNKDNELVPFVSETNINSDAVIACFDSFCETITKKKFCFCG